jgi:hypothetical protein
MTVRCSFRFALSCALGSTITLPAWSQSKDGRADAQENYDVRAASSADESYGVVFDDDPMFALGPDTLIPLLKVRTNRFPVTRLLRPRASFVPELLKSVESF